MSQQMDDRKCGTCGAHADTGCMVKMNGAWCPCNNPGSALYRKLTFINDACEHWTNDQSLKRNKDYSTRRQRQ